MFHGEIHIFLRFCGVYSGATSPKHQQKSGQGQDVSMPSLRSPPWRPLPPRPQKSEFAQQNPILEDLIKHGTSCAGSQLLQCRLSNSEHFCVSLKLGSCGCTTQVDKYLCRCVCARARSSFQNPAILTNRFSPKPRPRRERHVSGFGSVAIDAFLGKTVANDEVIAKVSSFRPLMETPRQKKRIMQGLFSLAHLCVLRRSEATPRVK